jgi:hypothetical protein
MSYRSLLALEAKLPGVAVSLILAERGQLRDPSTLLGEHRMTKDSEGVSTLSRQRGPVSDCESRGVSCWFMPAPPSCLTWTSGADVVLSRYEISPT